MFIHLSPKFIEYLGSLPWTLYQDKGFLISTSLSSFSEVLTCCFNGTYSCYLILPHTVFLLLFVREVLPFPILEKQPPGDTGDVLWGPVVHSPLIIRALCGRDTVSCLGPLIELHVSPMDPLVVMGWWLFVSWQPGLSPSPTLCQALPGEEAGGPLVGRDGSCHSWLLILGIPGLLLTCWGARLGASVGAWGAPGVPGLVWPLGEQVTGCRSFGCWCWSPDKWVWVLYQLGSRARSRCS